jgi:hypothetical protein
LNRNISEIASQLQAALVEAQHAHEALEKAKAALGPLEAAAMEKDEAVFKADERLCRTNQNGCNNAGLKLAFSLPA